MTQTPASGASAPPDSMLSRLLAASRRRASAAAFMTPRDIGLFLRSARTDAAIASRRGSGDAEAFDAAYAGGDPWASGDPRYRYQQRKYDVLAGLLPKGQRFANALDLGCGHGLLARRILAAADRVTGLDISQIAVDQARLLHKSVPALSFARADVRSLPPSLDGGFDLVVLADTLYYLPPPLTDDMLKSLALRVASLLAPGGICLLANHYFFAGDRDSRLSRRIHDAFEWSPGLQLVSAHRRPFYIVSLLKSVRKEGALF